MRARLFVIGCTGSVGSSVLSVCRAYPDRFEVRAVAARSSAEKIEQIADEFKSSAVVLTDASAATNLADRAGDRFSVLSGISAMEETAARSDIDHVVVASSGTEAVHALLRALRE
ncbi:MAG: 1-deoxy-D-xylulose-5-phosphate reductoisomerase, partial [Synergistales bacterium]|nr:1-deoxy-D-xylulose-5-phosphate reductoisomerase [Synergistales bacterium]